MITTRQFVASSQISFFGCITVCAALMPKYLLSHNEGGISNYGVHSRTVLFYSLAFIVCAGLQLLAAKQLPHRRSNNGFRLIYIISAVTLMTVLLTTYPYKVNVRYDDLHTLATILAFCFQIIAGSWLTFACSRSKRKYRLYVFQLVTFVLVVCNFFGIVHLLFIAEVLTALSFGLLMLAATPRALVTD